MSTLYKAEEMLFSQMRDLDRDKTLLILPVSSLEVHGHHLPMGMDTFFASMNAADLAEAFARKHADWAVVLYPPLTIGTDELPLAGSIATTPRTLRSAIIGFGNSLTSHGFKYIVVTNGHGGPRQPPALEEACQRVSRKRGAAMIAPSMRVLYAYVTGAAIPRIEAEIGRALSEEEKTALSLGGEHAAILETSLLLAYRPELVSDSYRASRTDGPPRVGWIRNSGRPLAATFRLVGLKGASDKISLIFDGIARNLGWWLNTRRGYGDHLVTYMGNPSAASAELGKALRKLIAQDLLEEVELVITGRTLPSDVHSIYWTAPILRTDFFRNLGLVATALLVALLMLLLL